MITNLTEVSTYLYNKNVCLLGNSDSILLSQKVYTNYDIICRINRGTPQGKEQYIGDRTDILFIATRLIPQLYQAFNPKYVVWTTECQYLATDWVKEYAYQNPPEDWRELKDKFTGDKLPSTGLVAIQFLVKRIAFKSLTILGFDFFKTGTHYHKMKKQPWHDGNIEKSIIMDLIKNKPNIRLVQE